MVKRFGKLQVRRKTLARVGAGSAQGDDFSVALAQGALTKNLKFLPTSPKLRAGRREPLSMDETKMCQRKSGELCRVATVSQPDICALLAKLALRG